MISMVVILFNDTATTGIYTLSLHDALPICGRAGGGRRVRLPARTPRARSAPARPGGEPGAPRTGAGNRPGRSEEHTSELQSRHYLVCRLLLEKKIKRPLPPRYAPPQVRAEY